MDLLNFSWKLQTVAHDSSSRNTQNRSDVDLVCADDKTEKRPLHLRGRIRGTRQNA
jgi:hypothetical protein